MENDDQMENMGADDMDAMMEGMDKNEEAKPEAPASE